MADEEEPQCKVEYIDLPDGGVDETNWIKRAGKAKVTYINADTFEGSKKKIICIFIPYCH